MRLQGASNSSLTVKSEGLYLALLDNASPLNTPELWHESWEIAKKASNYEQSEQLFHFNEIWSNHANTSHLLTWVLNFDGVYRIDIVVSSHELSHLEGEPISFVGLGKAEANLRVSSGTLVLENLYNLGRSNINQIILSPGLYKVALTVNWDQQESHQFLENVAEYPNQDGPDYILYLTRLSA